MADTPDDPAHVPGDGCPACLAAAGITPVQPEVRVTVRFRPQENDAGTYGIDWCRTSDMAKFSLLDTAYHDCMGTYDADPIAQGGMMNYDVNQFLAFRQAYYAPQYVEWRLAAGPEYTLSNGKAKMAIPAQVICQSVINLYSPDDISETASENRHTFASLKLLYTVEGASPPMLKVVADNPDVFVTHEVIDTSLQLTPLKEALITISPRAYLMDDCIIRMISTEADGTERPQDKIVGRLVLKANHPTLRHKVKVMVITCVTNFSQGVPPKSGLGEQVIDGVKTSLSQAFIKPEFEECVLDLTTNLFTHQPGSAFNRTGDETVDAPNAFFEGITQEIENDDFIARCTVVLPSGERWVREQDKGGKMTQETLDKLLQRREGDRVLEYHRMYVFGERGGYQSGTMWMPLGGSTNMQHSHQENGELQQAPTNALMVFSTQEVYTGAHELLHSMGLMHTFQPGSTYQFEYLMTDNIMDYSGSPYRTSMQYQWERLRRTLPPEVESAPAWPDFPDPNPEDPLSSPDGGNALADNGDGGNTGGFLDDVVQSVNDALSSFG